MKRTFFILSTIFLISCESINPKLTNDSSVKVGVLDNNLTYYIKNNTYPKDRIELLLVVNTGSIMENDNQQGLAHFAEHMAFNGTEKYPKQELVNYLESIGMKFGPDLNAYTSFDETVYMLQVPTDDKEVVAKGFEILYQWADKISFEDEEIDKERGVVIEEWRLGRGANERIMQQQIPVLFQDSKYADRLPIGKKEVLEEFDYQTVRDFYNDWYRSDLMSVVVVGDIDVEDAENYIKKYFNKMEFNKDARERVIEQVPDFHNFRVSVATDKELRFPMLGVYYAFDPTKVKDTEHYYRNSLISNIIVKMFNMRLNELTKVENPPFMFAGSYTMEGMIRGRELFGIYAGIQETQIKDSFKDLLIEIERVTRHGFLQVELDRIKSSILNDLETAVNEKDKTESKDYRFKYKDHYLNGSPFLSQEDELRLYNEMSSNISIRDVNHKVSGLFLANNKVFTIEAPEKEGLDMPKEDDIRAIYYEVASAYIKAYEEEAITQKLFDKEIDNGNIVSDKYLTAIDATELELSNGIKVIYKKTDFKNDEVLFKAFSPGGHSVAKDDNFISANQAADIISQSGLGSFDQITLDKYLSDKNVTVKPYINELFEGFEGKSNNKDLEILFQLIHLYFTSPNKDQIAFNTYKERLKGLIINNSNNPERVFFDSVNVITNNRHLREFPLDVNSLDKISLDNAYDFYLDRFQNPEDFTFLFVGSLDETIFYKYLNKYLASIPQSNRVDRWVDVGKRFPTKPINATVYKGIEPKSFVYLGFGGPEEWSELSSHKIKTLTHTLKIRLREILREDMGGTYGVWMWSALQHYPKGQYKLNLLFGCSPENVESMTNTVFAKIDSFKTYGLNEKYLKKTKEMQLNELDKKLEENDYWLDELFSAYINDSNSFDRLLENYNDVINSISNDDIKNLISKYFSDKNLVKIVLYPENK